MIDYNGKKFIPISNSENGETSSDMVFIYHQEGNIITSSYAGGKIKKGHLIGLVSEEGRIDMRYHQVNTNNELMIGSCISIPELLDDGRIRLHEEWQWTSGDKSKGKSVLEEQEVE